MKNPLSHGIGTALSLAIAAATASAFVAHAGPQGDPVIRQISPGELHNLESRQRRLVYQQRQQIYREQDSQIVVRPQRLEVPVMRPRCPLQTSGTPRTC
jgi:hypothetical protein